MVVADGVRPRAPAGAGEKCASSNLLDRARTADAPWVRILGPVPQDGAARSTWTAAAWTVAAYRGWYGITDLRHPLGPVVETDRRGAGERELAADALATLGVDDRGRQALERRSARSAAPAPERECWTSVSR